MRNVLNKRIALLSILFIFFLSIAMVSAANDISTDDVVSSSEDLKTDFISTSNEEFLNEDNDAVALSENADEDIFNEDNCIEALNEDSNENLNENLHDNLNENLDEDILNDDRDDVEIVVNCPTVVNESNVSLTVGVFDGESPYVLCDVGVYLNDNFLQKYIVDDDEYPITIENLALGKNTIKFVYEGNQFYNPTTKEISVTYANGKLLFLDIAAEKYDIKVGEYVHIIFNANTSEGPVNDIDVSLYINDEYKGDFNINTYLSFYALNQGSYNLKAVFAGNDIYTPAESSLITVIATKADVNITVNVDKNEIAIDEEAHLTFNANDTLESGILDVYVDDEKVGAININDTFTFIGMDAGEHSLYFVYDGNDTYNSFTTETVYIKVNKKVPVIVVNPIETNVEIGKSAVFELSSPESGFTGGLDVYVDNVKVGTAHLGENYSYACDSIGIHSIYFVYNETDRYESYTTETIPFTVYTNTKIQVDAKDIVYGQDAKINIKITDLNNNVLDKSFNVSFCEMQSLNPFELNYTVVSSDSRVISGLRLGNYSIVANFIGDDLYKSTTAIYQFHVMEKPTVANATINVSVKRNTVLIDLTDLDRNPIANADVEAFVNGEKSILTTDAEGKANLTITEDSTIIVNYTDDYGLSVSDKLAVFYQKVESRKATQIIFEDLYTTAVDYYNDGRVGEYFKWKLEDADGNALPNVQMKIGFNGVVYDYRDGIVTDDEGYAQLQINLASKGIYTFAICFLGDDDYNASFVVAKIDVKTQTPSLTVPSKSYSASAKTKTLSATFKSNKGTVIPKKKISFTVNGKTYTAKTNEKGVATVNVSLTKKGTYTVTAKFAGDNTYSSISKNAKLTIK